MNMPVRDGAWPRPRLRRVSRFNPSKSEVAGRAGDTEVSFLPMEAVSEDGKVDWSSTKPLSEVYGGYTYFANSDVVVAKITPCFENGKGALVDKCVNGIGFGTTEFHVIRPGPELQARFLAYWMRTHRFRNEGAAMMTGAAGQQRVPEGFIKNFRISLPPCSVQRAIADFLDRKTAAIDALIADKERLLALLAEKRAALIHRAVTKGLDPDVPMKDSGIPWIGEVPAHWEVKRLKFHMSDVVDCLHSTPEYREDGSFPAIRTADLIPGRLDVAGAQRVDDEAFLARIRRLKPQAGDIIYSREGERYGMAALVPPETELCLAQRVMMLRTHDEHDARFVMWALNSAAVFHQVRQDTVGATSPRVNIETIRNAWLAVPPLGEQRGIGDAVEAGIEAVDDATELIQAHIDKLREYRQALITAAVTGQIDVTGQAEEEAA
ncbi:MAG: restriction endonuclease subunit S [Myxococcota bacterium]